MAPKRKKTKALVEKADGKRLIKEIRKDLHSMVLEAEGAIALRPRNARLGSMIKILLWTACPMGSEYSGFLPVLIGFESW